MESRFQHLFLMHRSALKALCAGLVGSLLLAVHPFASAQEDEGDDELGQIITPDIERRSIKEEMIDSENFEFGAFYGMLGIEDFGTNEVAGITMAYHITEDFFAEASYGMSRLQKTSYELLSGGVELLTDEERDLTYYNLSLGYNLFPGQIHISDKWAFNTRIYLIAGAGNTQFASKDYFTYNFGAGLRFFATDWVSFDLSMRDHVFTHELFGESKDTHNLEGRFGLSLFF
jgi:outer membrane beta-barrel protein